ncbi:MAG: CPBP family intramembrane metalloprotease [Candidatus Diapherotrites archaeon]|nr:CPBP family intramembrane metalloprotease [Candidatus Diapherotrites archaeon]
MRAASALTPSGRRGENNIIPLQQLFIDFTLIFFPLLFYKLEKKDPLAELGLYSNGLKKDALNAIGLFAALTAITIAISVASSFLNVNDLDKVYDSVERLKTTGPALLGYLLVARVIAEEIFFRGFLAKKTGAVISSIVFGALHASYGSAVEITGAIVLGYVLAKAFESNKNLLPNIFAHFLYNLTVVLIV